MHWFYFGASYSCYFAFSLLLLLRSTLAMVLIYLIVSILLLFFQYIYFFVWAACLFWILFRCLLEDKKLFGHLRLCFRSRFLLSQFLRWLRLHRYASEKYRGTLAFASCICGPVAFLLASVHKWRQHCNASSRVHQPKHGTTEPNGIAILPWARIFSYSPSTIYKVRAESLAIFYVIKLIVRSCILSLLK